MSKIYGIPTVTPLVPGATGGGVNGKSAYELAVSEGYEGTLTEWLESLVGPQGERGERGPQGPTGADAPIDTYLPKDGSAPMTGELSMGGNRITGVGAPVNDDDAVRKQDVRPAGWTPTATEVGARPNTWMPTASDVGARPNTWIPTADQVGARPNTWTPTAEDVGARPSSYEYPSKNGGDANDYKTETHLFVFNMTNLPQELTGDLSFGFFDVWRASGSGFSHTSNKAVIKQRFVTYHHGHYVAWRTSTDDGSTWSEWEHENPPMILGKSYRTAERWNGKVVYTKLLNFGTMPNTTTKSVSHGLTGINIIRCCGQNITLGQTIPSNYMGNGSYIYADTNAVHIHSTVDSTAHSAYAQIWYVKV